ncbi:hypothetical protein [Pseudomonas sp. NPDC087614]|uniref:hypothetical protein n=1 Tax=Pseudomonas sp. NPDC087614 TaxID=3364442 RepID=UPI00380F922D
MTKFEMLIMATISVTGTNTAFAEIDPGCKQLWDATSAAQTCTLSTLTKYYAGGAAVCAIEADCRGIGMNSNIPNNMNAKEVTISVHNKESVSVQTILNEGLNNCNGKLTYKSCQ